MDDHRIDDLLRSAGRAHAGSVGDDPSRLLETMRPGLRRSRSAHRARIVAATGAVLAVAGGFAVLSSNRTTPDTVVAGPGPTPTLVAEPTPTPGEAAVPGETATPAPGPSETRVETLAGDIVVTHEAGAFVGEPLVAPADGWSGEITRRDPDRVVVVLTSQSGRLRVAIRFDETGTPAWTITAPSPAPTVTDSSGSDDSDGGDDSDSDDRDESDSDDRDESDSDDRDESDSDDDS